MLAYVTGEVEESLLLRIEYLIEENRVLRNQLDRRLKLTDHGCAAYERIDLTLCELATKN